MEHFGVTIKEGKYGFKLTRENFAVVNPRSSFSGAMMHASCRETLGFDPYTDDTYMTWTNEWCLWHLNNCMENYDLNMRYFAQLDKEEFANCINAFLRKNRQFIPVADLKLYDGQPGYYLLVLDDYCQAYLGTSDNIMCRIRQHWSNRKAFDRILFPIGNVTGSVISIDSFRALDTIRIYVRKTSNTYASENPYIEQIPNKFLANRIQGGRFLEDFWFPEIKTRELPNS